jgi:hypothetical protein
MTRRRRRWMWLWLEVMDCLRHRPIQCIPEAVSAVVQCLGREPDRSPPPTSEVKDTWIYTSTQSLCLHVAYRDSVVGYSPYAVFHPWWRLLHYRTAMFWICERKIEGRREEKCHYELRGTGPFLTFAVEGGIWSTLHTGHITLGK